MKIDYSKLGVKLMFDILVDDTMRNEHGMLAYLHGMAKNLKKDTIEAKILGDEIRALRHILKQKAQSQYRVVYQQKNRSRYTEDGSPLMNEQVYVELPDPYAFREVVDDVVKDVKSFRRQDRDIEVETRSILGFNYEVVGGVFQPNKKRGAHNIIEIGKNTDPMRRIGVEKKPHPKIKAKYVGFELELMTTMRREDLCALFVKKNLAGYVYVKGDGSIRVEADNEQAHEVTVLCRQDSVESIMGLVCEVLNSASVRAKVNNSCGLHAHIDMRNRDPKLAYNNLVRALPLLNKLVPPLRVGGAEAKRYCRQNDSGDLMKYYVDIDGTLKYNGNRDADRYQAINPVAFGRFTTIEVRLHSGTTNFKKIINWSKICTSIADAPMLNQDIKTVEDFERFVLNDAKLSEYMRARIHLFETKRDAIDTRADYVLDMMEVG